MLTIDTDDKSIDVTRGDYFAIVFGAHDAAGDDWNPENVGVDSLTFAVAKTLDDPAVISVTNVFDGDTDKFWTIEVGADGSTDWYKKDDSGNVVYGSDNKPELIDPGKYVWDLEVGTSVGPITIIGKDKETAPKFTVWGDVANRG